MRSACVDAGTQTLSCPPHMTVSFRVDSNGIVLTHQRVRVRASRLPVPFLLLLNEPNAALDVPTEADSANAVGSNPAQRDV